ncbi:MAG: ABC transporter permease [Candidatus Dormibacteraeota bacterium]|nr:ABC transporter permease [Candidatus Dormibacteraeota bacterium]
MSDRLGIHRAGAAVLGRDRLRSPAAPEAVAAGRRRPKRRAFDQPSFLTMFTVVVFVYLFAPILVVIWFSFNSARSLQIFRSFSLTWYAQLLQDRGIMGSLGASVEIALVTMVVATVIGTLLAFGLVRARSRANRPTDVLMLLNLVSPEIVTAIALLLVFSQAGAFLSQYGIQFGLSLVTVVLGHITFSIAYVTIIVRGRLVALNREVEEAALDLGATNLGAMRLVTLPLLWPAIIASGMLVFVMSFDDFVTSFFTSGVDVQPLPLRIYSMIHFGVTPEINAVGTLMMVITIVIVLAALALFTRQQNARRQLAFLAE